MEKQSFLEKEALKAQQNEITEYLSTKQEETDKSPILVRRFFGVDV